LGRRRVGARSDRPRLRRVAVRGRGVGVPTATAFHAATSALRFVGPVGREAAVTRDDAIDPLLGAVVGVQAAGAATARFDRRERAAGRRRDARRLGHQRLGMLRRRVRTGGNGHRVRGVHVWGRDDRLCTSVDRPLAHPRVGGGSDGADRARGGVADSRADRAGRRGAANRSRVRRSPNRVQGPCRLRLRLLGRRRWLRGFLEAAGSREQLNRWHRARLVVALRRSPGMHRRCREVPRFTSATMI